MGAGLGGVVGAGVVVAGVVGAAGVVAGVVEAPAPLLVLVPLPALVVSVPVDGVVGVTPATVVVVVVARCCGLNGLRPLPASFEFVGEALIWIAGSVAPDEYGSGPVGGVTMSVGACLVSRTGTATRAMISTSAIGQSLRSTSSLSMLRGTLIAAPR